MTTLAGCESEVSSRSDLGRVVFEVPKVPGAQKYKIPPLAPGTEQDGARAHGEVSNDSSAK